MEKTPLGDYFKSFEWRILRGIISDFQVPFQTNTTVRNQPELFRNGKNFVQCGVSIIFRLNPAYFGPRLPSNSTSLKNRSFEELETPSPPIKSSTKVPFPPTRLEQLISSKFLLTNTQLPPNFLQFLLIKRDSKGTHAGQLAYPGGHCDGDQETDYQAAIREAFEEVGIDLSSSDFAYLGATRKNFDIYINPPKKRVYVRPHIFFHLVPGEEPHLTLDPKEVEKHYWVDFDMIVRPKSSLLSVQVIPDEETGKLPFQFPKGKFMNVMMLEVFKKGYFLVYKMLPNETPFFGISFYLMFYFVRAGLEQMGKGDRGKFREEIRRLEKFEILSMRIAFGSSLHRVLFKPFGSLNRRFKFEKYSGKVTKAKGDEGETEKMKELRPKL